MLGQSNYSKFDALGARNQSHHTSHSSMFELSKKKVSMQEKVEKEAPFLNHMHTQRKIMKESMTIKDVIMSVIAINDALISSIAYELCNNDSNNNNTMCNLKHVKSFIELAVIASKKHMMNMHL